MLRFIKKRQKPTSTSQNRIFQGLIAYEVTKGELPKIIAVNDMLPQGFVEKMISTTCQILQEKDSPIPGLIVEELVTNLAHGEFAHPVITISYDGRQMTVSDQGPGIPSKENAVKLGYYGKPPKFTPSQMRGVGVGLPMVRKMLTSIEGKLLISDNLGGGTVVRIWIPPEMVDDTRESEELQGPKALVEQGFPPLFEPENAPTEEGDSPRRTESYIERTSDERGLSRSSKDEYEPSLLGTEGPAVAEALSDLQTKLSRRQRRVLFLVADLGEVGPSTASTELDMSLSTAFRDLVTLEEMDLVQSDENGKRSLTPLGARVIAALTA